jgi:hypothetical protein
VGGRPSGQAAATRRAAAQQYFPLVREAPYVPERCQPLPRSPKPCRPRRSHHWTRLPSPLPRPKPEFLTWLQYAGDDALKTWGRHRLAEPVAHFVYLRRHASGALYVGVTRVDELKHPIRTHDRYAARDALPDAPSEFYSWFLGQGELIDLRFVPDEVTALLLEAEATCALAAAGDEAFGHYPDALCPARD